MKDKFETFIQVDEAGTAKVFNREFMDAFFKQHPNQRFELVIHKQRSKQQNKYYWSVLRLISDELGNEADDRTLHEIFKFKFLQVNTGIIDETTGEVLIHVKSTTGLSKQEFIDYLENISRYVAQSFNIVVPPPGEQLSADYEETN